MNAEGHPSGHHAFFVVSGYGLRIIPIPPYRMFHGPNKGELDVEHYSRDGERFARVISDGNGGYRSKIGQNTGSLAEVLIVEPSDFHGDWLVDGGDLQLPLPAGFAVHSTPADSVSPLTLVGPEEAMISMQSPVNTPNPSSLCGPGQRVIESGEGWVELEYEFDSQKWWQRHQIVDKLVYSAQAPANARNLARTALEELLKP